MDLKAPPLEDTIMQQYPTPSEDAHDSGGAGAAFVNNSDNPHAHHLHAPSTESTDSPASSHQQGQTSDAQAQELQLAAQLSENLSSIMPGPPSAPQDATVRAEKEQQPVSVAPVAPVAQPQPAPVATAIAPPVPAAAPASGVQSTHVRPLGSTVTAHVPTPAPPATMGVSPTTAAAAARVSNVAAVAAALTAVQQQSESQHQQFKPDYVPQPGQHLSQLPPRVHQPLVATQHVNIRPQLPSQTHTHAQAAPRAQSSQFVQEQLQQPVLAPQAPPSADRVAIQYVATGAASMDNTPSRKRSKVSRACDECRRKKVKCDAQSESGEEPCSNCRRSMVACAFSRVPQKRGPSKGYIKELADRLNQIEGQLGSGATVRDLLSLASGEAPMLSPPPPASTSVEPNERKRPYSSISADLDAPNVVSQLASWGSEPRAPPTTETPTASRPHQPYADSLAPTPAFLMEEASAPEGPIPSSPREPAPPTQMPEVDYASFMRYLSFVHPALPFLPSSQPKLQFHLGHCETALGSAFLDAFHLAMGVSPWPTPNLVAVAEKIAEWETSSDLQPVPDSRLRSTLVHIQALLLSGIASDAAGPEPPNQSLSMSSFLSRAKAIAFGSKLFKQALHRPLKGAEDDEDFSLTIQTFWSMVILDRFNAVSAGSPMAIPADYAVLLKGHQPILGETTYYLAELSECIAHMLPVLQSGLSAAHGSSPEKSIISQAPGYASVKKSGLTLLNFWRRRLPESITSATHPLVDMAHEHVRIIACIMACSRPSQHLFPATQLMLSLKAVVQRVVETPELLGPFSHHFVSLAALALQDMSKVPEHREEATSLLDRLLETNIHLGPWMLNIRQAVGTQNRPSTSGAAAASTTQTTASQSLEHLADLATTGVSVPTGEDSIDLLPLVQDGYFTVLSAKASP